MTVRASRRRGRNIQPIPKGRRTAVPRDEYNRLIDTLNERGELLRRLLQDHEHLLKEQQIQFQRIAQVQAELDLIKKQWARLKSLDG